MQEFFKSEWDTLKAERGTTEEVPEQVQVTEQEEVQEGEVQADESTPDEIPDFIKQTFEYVKENFKHNKSPIELDSVEEWQEITQRGFDHPRQVQKNEALKNQTKARNEVVKDLYPELSNVDELMQKLINYEVESIEEHYKEKYPDKEDLERVLKGDERYQKLKNREPIKFDAEKEVETLNKEAETLNEAFGTNYKSYADIPVEIREIAGANNLSLEQAYKLHNFDEIVSKEKEKAKKSTIADLSENKSKTLPKDTSKTPDSINITEMDKEFAAAFGFGAETMKKVAAKRKKK